MKFSAPWLLGFFLIAVGLGIFFYKTIGLGFPLTPNAKSSSWHVEAKLEFNGRNKPLKVTMRLPRDTDDLSTVDESFIGKEYGINTAINKETGNRESYWTKRQGNGHQVIFYNAVLYQVNAAISREEDDGETEQTPKPDAPFLFGTPEFSARAETDPVYASLKALIEEIRSHSADTNSFVSELFKQIGGQENNQIKALRQQGSSVMTDAVLSSYILNVAGIPARIVNGLKLAEEERHAPILQWIEVYNDGKWNAVNMETGHYDMKGKLLTWWYGAEPLYSLEGGKDPHISIAVKQNTQDAIIEAIWKGDKAARVVYNLSLMSLPVDTQIIFHILLLVPVGALVNAFLRQMIGIKAFGTFMPVLAALSFRETGLVWGVILFTGIVTIGLLIRSYFDRLQLLMVPRLAAILTVVVIVISGLSVIAHHLGITIGLSISLFPMVILTMTIERMTLMWEEIGAKEAIRTGINSIIVAVIAYLCMYNAYTFYLVFTFPELLLIVLTLNIWMGRYNGYKLTEYRRFRSIANTPHASV